MHYTDLFTLDLTTKETVEAILDGYFKVDGYTDNLQLAEDYLLEVERQWAGENTKPAWDIINNAVVS